jgi:hypothetical protein
VKDCRTPRKEQANLTHEDDAESLLMAQVCEIVTEPASPKHGLHLHEPTAHVFLGADGDADQVEGWYLATGATSHMTGRAAAFSVLDRAIQGTVQFGDGSLSQFRGAGSLPSPTRPVSRSSWPVCSTYHASRTTSSLSGSLTREGARWRSTRAFSECGTTTADSSSRYTVVRTDCTFYDRMLQMGCVSESSKEKMESMSVGTHIMATMAMTRCNS